MELRDIIVTPFWILIIYVIAWLIRPRVTDEVTKKYFFPALTLRIIGALAVGFIYQFYYGDGDTFSFHTRGSRIMWEAFMDSPEKGFQLFIHGASDTYGVYKYASKIIFLTDQTSFVVIRLAFIFDILTFSSYSATALLFGVLGFAGMWMFFITFYKQYPHLHRGFAVAAFFIPSVFFWGSGLLKDTVCLAFLGIATYEVYSNFIASKISWRGLLLLTISLVITYNVKPYIVLTFLPAAIVWIFLVNLKKINSTVVRWLFFPFVFIGAMTLAYLSILRAGGENEKYSINRVAQTAQVTAYDIRYYSGKAAGSGYTLGELDGSLGSMIKLAPQAINVSLFRPYLWEVKNPLMLLSALESFTFLVVVLALFYRGKVKVLQSLHDPTILFLFIFSIVFAFSVGVSTYNFGSLVRYKIPMMPFFGVMLALINDYLNSAIKLEELELVE
jgi:hypothetical protein